MASWQLLFIVEGTGGPARTISNHCFLSDAGLIEFEITQDNRIISGGKATPPAYSQLTNNNTLTQMFPSISLFNHKQLSLDMIRPLQLK